LALKSHASVDHQHDRNWRRKRPTIGARLPIGFGLKLTHRRPQPKSAACRSRRPWTRPSTRSRRSDDAGRLIISLRTRRGAAATHTAQSLQPRW